MSKPKRIIAIEKLVKTGEATEEEKQELLEYRKKYNARIAQWKAQNPGKSKEYNDKYKANNSERVALSKQQWRDKNPEYNHAYYEQHTDEIKQKTKEYQENNADKIKQTKHANYEKNKEHILEITKSYAKEHRGERNQRENDKYANDPMYRFKKNVRNLISDAIRRKGYQKESHTEDIIGCDYETAKKILENSYEEIYGIKFNGDYSKVHIDHMIPIEWAKTKFEVIVLNGIWNMQLLKGSENDSKQDKYGVFRYNNHPAFYAYNPKFDYEEVIEKIVKRNSQAEDERQQRR